MKKTIFLCFSMMFMAFAMNAQVAESSASTPKKACCKKSSQCTKTASTVENIDLGTIVMEKTTGDTKVASAASETIIEGAESKSCCSSSACSKTCSKVCKKVCKALGIDCKKKE